MNVPDSTTPWIAARSSSCSGASGVRVSNSGIATTAEATDSGPPILLAMVVTASLTDPIVEFAVDVIDALGLPGIFVLMLAESACIPIPSETTFLFAGFNVSRGEYSLFAVVTIGTLANLVGSWVAYAVGWYGRVDLLEKHGRKLH